VIPFEDNEELIRNSGLPSSALIEIGSDHRLAAPDSLAKSFNASYGDKPCNEKREHYFGQNLLAQSLHAKAYELNPGFLRFKERTQLPFQPHEEFRKSDMDARQELYRRIAEQIWTPENLLREVDE
jgi:hypothetical protein